MVKLLIIADDFTGALDTGVQFAASGAETRVVTNAKYDMKQIEDSVEVLVMDAETRHLSEQEAYKIVYEITKRAYALGVAYIYKKTDSALRGNIGSELTAVLDGAKGRCLHFLPAFPKMKRTTINGIHCIDGKPVHESVFGEDPYEPVTCSYIPEIIGAQSRVKVVRAQAGEWHKQEEEPMVIVYDAQTEQQVEQIAVHLQKTNQLNLLAGCAGFAAVLPRLLNIGGGKPKIPQFENQFLVVCGSVNPITKNQLDYAENNGFIRIRFTPEQKLEQGYFDTEAGMKTLEFWRQTCQKNARCILDTNDLPMIQDTINYAKAKGIALDELRVRIATNLGIAVKKLVEAGVDSTMLITGGDTLLGFMNQIESYEMTPVCELAPGTVLSQCSLRDKRYQVISKSGGFGDESLLVTLADEILRGEISGC